MNVRFNITVKFQVNAESAEDAEELIDSLCEKATRGSAEGEISYEGIEDVEEEEEESRSIGVLRLSRRRRTLVPSQPVVVPHLAPKGY